jgi:exo-beta-1,3-glucanase (GH17 family)
MRPNILPSTLTTLVLLVVAAGSLIYWVLQGRAHSYPDAPAGKFACLSYTPRSGTSQGVTHDIHAQIDSDLQQLAKRTSCVRTYSVMNGLDYVPAAARKLGMRVLLGIWIGSNKDANEQEINRAIAVANADRDVIDAVIVGNEVLLRREQTADALYGMLVRVRAATQLPVTYADVWAFWLKNPKLAEVSDFVSIHILPYWEDDPVGIDHAMGHVDAIFQKVQRVFPGKRIYVGEVGWPSAGRQREAANPSLLNQARFTREFIALANRLNLPYNFIEAYDQPWKKSLEGTVGGYWGLYDAQGREKFPLLGSVIADAQWWRGPLAGGLVALMLLVLTRRIAMANNTVLLTQMALAGIGLGCVGVMQWDYLWRSNQDWLEWLIMGSWTLLCYAVGLLSLFEWQSRWPRIWNGLLTALLLSLAYINLGLVFDARYRDFPSVFLLLPAVLLVLKGAQGAAIVRSGEGLLLSIWLLASSLAIASIEHINNGSALCWCALTALLGLRLLFDYWCIAGRIVGTRTARQ